jgi:hypothetical protein
MTSLVEPAPTSLVDRIDAAVRRNKIIIIVIDIWSLTLKHYADLMAVYDALAKLHCAAIVVWNTADPEESASKPLLSTKLRSIFRFKTTVRDPTSFRDDIDSVDELRMHLRRSLVTIQQRIINAPDSEPARAVGPGATTTPRISGPGET